ncbi:MAG: sirohydrochlorin chelatase [Terriglobia bacterium]
MSQEPQATGILLFAHGSSVEEANEGVRELARQVQALGPFRYVRATFLDLAHPDLAEAVAEAVQAGFRHLIIVPHFLTMGIHLRRDLPSLITPLKQKYPAISLEVTQSLEGHPLMASIILERVREVIGAAKATR